MNTETLNTETLNTETLNTETLNTETLNTELFELSIMNPTFIFVDGSYFCFYRYYSLMNWWKNAYPEEKLDDPYNNKKFVIFIIEYQV